MLNGGNGRVIIGTNVGAVDNTSGQMTGATGAPTGSSTSLQGVTSSSVEYLQGEGADNPYIAGSTWTPNISGTTGTVLDGGANVFGLSSTLTAAQLDYGTSNGMPDPNALVAVLRYSMANASDNPLQESIPGYDLVLVANVSGVPLSGVDLGFGLSTPVALQTEGLGGANPTAVTLPANGVWAMLVPTGVGVSNGGGTTDSISLSISSAVSGRDPGRYERVAFRWRPAPVHHRAVHGRGLASQSSGLQCHGGGASDDRRDTGANIRGVDGEERVGRRQYCWRYAAPALRERPKRRHRSRRRFEHRRERRQR